jgi:hypothetical protein
LRNEASPRKWAYSELRGKRFVRTKKFKLYGNGEFFDVATNPLKEILIRDSGGLSPEETEARLLLQNALDSVPAPAN